MEGYAGSYSHIGVKNIFARAAGNSAGLTSVGSAGYGGPVFYYNMNHHHLVG